MKKRSGSKSLPPEGDSQQRHFTQVDLLKGFAIISVILMHTYNRELLLAIGAPFYLFQAVPVFILLAAFNNAHSLSAMKEKTLARCYDPAILFRRLKRLLIPYGIIWILQLIIVFWILAAMIDIPVQNPNHFFYTGIDTLFNFLTGSSGPGNYFVPLIVQLIFLVPLLYWLALRSPDMMLAGAFVADLVLEYLAVISGMPTWLYGTLVTPFLFMAALGVWLVFRDRVVTPWILAGGLLSAAYIAAVSYFNFQFWFFRTDTSFHHVFAFFWTLLIVILGFQYLPSRPSGRIVGMVSELGKASWHIFLVQMTYFFFLGYTYSPADQSPGVAVLLAFFYLIPCLSIGYGFYRVQNYFMGTGKNPA
jgi:peptidoglycan/LPS O-acetylase OafA/YrhL